MARQGWLNRRIENAVRTQVRAAASEAGDQYARSVKDTGAQYARSLKDTEDAATRVINRASRKAGRLMLVGGGSLGAALTAPVAVHHGLKSRRERTMAKNYDSLSDLAAVAKGYWPERGYWTGRQRKASFDKAWKGESGDKRNTKYYLAAGAGANAGGVASFATRPVRAGIREQNRIIDSVTQRHMASENPNIHRFLSDSMKEVKASPIVRRARRISGAASLTGLAAGVGGYAALRNSPGMKRKRQARVAARRMQGEVAKRAALPREQQQDLKFATLSSALAGPLGSGAFAATRAKKGRKVAYGGRSYGRSLAEGAAGAVPGSAAYLGGALAASQGKSKLAVPLIIGGGLAAHAGALGGSIHGSRAAYRNAVRRGDVDFKKAMTPNKIAGLRRAASRPAGSGMARSPFDASGMRRYAQARLGMAGVGQGIRNPSVPNLRQSLRSQASQYRPGVSFGAGVSNNGRPAARLP